MTTLRRILISALPILLLATRASAQVPEGARQMVLVTTGGWDETGARLQAYERDGATSPWRAVGTPVQARVGRTGLAWGTGLHAATEDAPQKREGDGKAPAGIFRLSSAFGYAPADSVRWIRLPYVQSDASIECVDDLRSRAYNQRVDRDTLPAPDWASHEEMRRPDELYRLGVWVDHNTAPQVPGRGSCIFLHIWAGPEVPTSGCTAMDAADLERLLAWLDPAARPVLVQLPEAEHARLRRAWNLP